MRCKERVMMETYVKIDSQQELSACPCELKQGLCINSERWDEEGDRREVQE